MTGGDTWAELSERRRDPRKEYRGVVAVVTHDGSTVECESVDVSVGGIRVVGSERIPLGPGQVIISDLILEGEVVEEIIDLVAGTVIARIIFAVRPAPIAEL